MQMETIKNTKYAQKSTKCNEKQGEGMCAFLLIVVKQPDFKQKSTMLCVHNAFLVYAGAIILPVAPGGRNDYATGHLASSNLGV